MPLSSKLLMFLTQTLMTSSSYEGNMETQDSRTEKGSLRLSEDQQKQRNQKIKPAPDTDVIKLLIEDTLGLFVKFWVLYLFLNIIGITTVPWAPRKNEQGDIPSCPQTLLSLTRYSLNLSKT